MQIWRDLQPNAKAGIGIYFGKNNTKNISRRFIGKQTNNSAELAAIIQAIFILENTEDINKKIIIMTDSEYSIKCSSTYGDKLNNNTWKDEIPNKDLVRVLYDLLKKYPNIILKHVKAHTGKTDKHSIGNSEADKLANESVI